METTKQIKTISKILTQQQNNNNKIKQNLLKENLSLLKQFSYNINFDFVLNETLNTENKNTIKEIKTIFKNYKNINQITNKHKIRLYRFLNNSLNYCKEEYKKIVDIENKNKFENIYSYKENLKNIRQQKRNILNHLKNSFGYYKKEFNILRQQHYLKSVTLHKQQKSLKYVLCFNLKNKNSEKDLNEKVNSKNLNLELFLKLDNKDENKVFDRKFKNLKTTLQHIKKLYVKRNTLSKKGYLKLLEITTKWFLRYNKNNRNIKVFDYMIYLFIVEYDLFVITQKTVEHINEILKDINKESSYFGLNKNKEKLFKNSQFKTTNIFKQKSYIYDGNEKEITNNKEIEFKTTKTKQQKYLLKGLKSSNFHNGNILKYEKLFNKYEDKESEKDFYKNSLIELNKEINKTLS